MKIRFNNKYICKDDKNIKLIFSTGEDRLNFKRNSEDFDKNIEEIRKNFNLDEMVFLNQIHSDKCYDYEELDGAIKDGDAIITNKDNVGIGVFTADCVPILIYDGDKGVIGACHSGWKGTLNKIIINTIKLMRDKYECENFKVVIGPHNMECCYEVGEDLINEFLKDDIYTNVKISKDKNLNLLNCIKAQLISVGVIEENIESVNYCTFCSKDVKFHSYRRDGAESGRNLSFVFMEG